MKFVVLALLILGSTAVFAQNGPICCTVNQWQGHAQGQAFYNNSGSAYYEYFNEYVYYSYPNAMRVDFVADINLNKINGTEIVSYAEGYAYFLQPNGPCYYSALPAAQAKMPQACVYNEGLINERRFTLGASLVCTRYIYPESPNHPFGANVVMAHPNQRSCVAVNGAFFEHQHGTQGNVQYTYWDVQESISDPMVFNHPGQSSCSLVSAQQFAALRASVRRAN